MESVRLRRLSVPMLRAVVWTLRARWRVRHTLSDRGIATPMPLPPAPAVPLDGTRAVVDVLGRTRSTCLVRSLILQKWLADHGQAVDLIIGVTSPNEGFRAHAWLDRPEEEGTEAYTELHRLAPPTQTVGRVPRWTRRDRRFAR